MAERELIRAENSWSIRDKKACMSTRSCGWIAAVLRPYLADVWILMATLATTRGRWKWSLWEKSFAKSRPAAAFCESQERFSLGSGREKERTSPRLRLPREACELLPTNIMVQNIAQAVESRRARDPTAAGGLKKRLVFDLREARKTILERRPENTIVHQRRPPVLKNPETEPYQAYVE